MPVYVLGVWLVFAVVLTVSTVLAYGRVWTRALPVPVLAFTWLSIALALFIGPTYFHAEARFLLPDFPLLLPAVFLARRNLYVATGVIAVCALLSAWYGGYLLTIWTHLP